MGALGRIPMTLWLARHIDANLIIWSTGSSRIIGGNWEATAFFKRALQSLAELKRDFPDRFADDWWSSEVLYQDWIQRISTTETTSQRTSDSFIEAKKIISRRFESKPVSLYSVSSANHAPRVLRDELIAFEYGTRFRSPHQNMTLCAVAAETCYGGGTIRDVQVNDLGTQLARRS